MTAVIVITPQQELGYIECNTSMCVISGLSQVSELGEWDAGRQEEVNNNTNIVA